MVTVNRGAAVVAAILILLASPGHASEATGQATGEPPLDRYRLGLAHIGQAEMGGDLVAIRWLGSGVLVDDRCTVATARHILEGIDPERLIVRLLHHEQVGVVRTYGARILYQDPERDIAMLGFASGEHGRKFCRSDAFRPLSLAGNFEPRRLTGLPVWVVGFPSLEGEQPRDVPIIRHGLVSSAELEWDGHPMLLLDLTGVPGFSGAPVVLERTGEVIGLVYGPGRTSRQYDLEWATPLTREDYDRARQQLTSD